MTASPEPSVTDLRTAPASGTGPVAAQPETAGLS